jgi:hypothetical protein
MLPEAGIHTLNIVIFVVYIYVLCWVPPPPLLFCMQYHTCIITCSASFGLAERPVDANKLLLYSLVILDYLWLHEN